MMDAPCPYQRLCLGTRSSRRLFWNLVSHQNAERLVRGPVPAEGTTRVLPGTALRSAHVP